MLGGDRSCQTVRAEAIAQIKLLNADRIKLEDNLDPIDSLWKAFDASTLAHPKAFEESLQNLLPDLSGRSEIEVDLISQLVLACGDVSLVPFLKISQQAIAAAREGLKSGCQIIVDVPAIAAALDRPRLAHLGCHNDILIDNPHIVSAAEAEQ